MPNLSALKSPLTRAAIAIILTMLLLSSNALPPAQAAAGDLDLTFGNGGKVITDFFGSFDIVNGLAVQQDGKIIAAGVTDTPGAAGDFALARYNSNGSLDPTFGSGGKVNTDFSGTSGGAQDVVILSDGKILAGGSADFDFALARYNSNGSLDPTFGSGGKVRTIFSDAGSITGIAIQSDGKIVAAGTVSTFQTNQEKFAVARYNSDGSLDATFGSGGKVVTDFFGDFDRVSDLVITADGKIVVAGMTSNGNGTGDFALARYNSNGSLDATFGSGGKVITDFFGGFEFCSSLSLQPDGKLIAAGDAGPLLALARYNIDGSLDSTFGVGGKAVDNVLVLPRDTAILPNGKIIAGGLGFDALTGGDFDFSVVRYNSDGSRDTTFGTGGKSSTNFPGDLGQANALALQPDGKVILGGGASQAQVFDFALARFDGDGPSFDICLNDDSSGSILQINMATGAYQFTNCSGFTISGTGSLTKRGSSITLQHTTSDRRVMAKVDGATNKATASIQMLSQGLSFTVTDRNTANNTCFCR